MSLPQHTHGDYKTYKTVEQTEMNDDGSVSRTCYRKSDILFKTLMTQPSRRGRPTDRPWSHVHTRHKERWTAQHARRLTYYVHTMLQFVSRSYTTGSAKRAKRRQSAIEYWKLLRQVLVTSSICTARISLRYSQLNNQHYWIIHDWWTMRAEHTAFIDHFDRLLKDKFKKNTRKTTTIVTQKLARPLIRPNVFFFNVYCTNIVIQKEVTASGENIIDNESWIAIDIDQTLADNANTSITARKS